MALNLDNYKKQNKNPCEIKILKCNKCNSIPFFKFYDDDDYSSSIKIFIKCKCKMIDNANYDELNSFYSLIMIQNLINTEILLLIINLNKLKINMKKLKKQLIINYIK